MEEEKLKQRWKEYFDYLLNQKNPRTMFPKLCAAEDLQVCRESFQNAFCCFKFSAKIEKMLPLQVTARELMTFFWEISTIWGCITRFSEIVAQKSGDLQKNKKKVITLLIVACDATRHQLE